jgi:hypothetical protein
VLPHQNVICRGLDGGEREGKKEDLERERERERGRKGWGERGG